MASRNKQPVQKNLILEGKYELIGKVPAKFSTGFGTFETDSLTEKQAELLIRKKVSFIRKVD